MPTPTPTPERTIKFLYQIFRQRFDASDLQRSFDASLRIGVLGGGAAVQELQETFKSAALPETTGEVVALDPQAADWGDQLAKLQGIIVLVGPPDLRTSLLDQFKQKRPAKLPYVVLCHGVFNESDRQDAKDLQTDLDLRPFTFTPELTADSLKLLAETWASELEPIAVNLARRYPFLRRGTSRHLIHKVSRRNFTIALASAIPANIPVLGLIAGTIAVAGELIVLTSNQLKLCLQIAGMYGMELNFWERMRELWPIVGSSFGWRQLSRSAVGFLPGAGPAIKAMIAYTGTFTCGEAALWFYEHGRRIDAGERRQVLDRARKEAVQRAKDLLSRFKKDKGGRFKAPVPEDGLDPIPLDDSKPVTMDPPMDPVSGSPAPTNGTSPAPVDSTAPAPAEAAPSPGSQVPLEEAEDPPISDGENPDVSKRS